MNTHVLYNSHMHPPAFCLNAGQSARYNIGIDYCQHMSALAAAGESSTLLNPCELLCLYPDPPYNHKA